MKISIALAALPLPLIVAGCEPMPGDAPANALAITACQRSDVQDVVGKEVRNMMLKANATGVFGAALLGVDIVKPMEQARVSFHDAGVYTTNTPAKPPFAQIICGARMQIDGSSASAGQDIVMMPRLRWSVNFSEPTEDPANATFTIAVDPASIGDGLLINGRPAPRSEQSDDEATPASGGESEADSAGPEAQQAAPLDDAQAAAADAAAEAAEAAADETPKRRQAPPTEDDLYAPHSN